MNKELLDEFLIKKYGEDYAILATDKAYELFGLKEKEVVSSNGVCFDSINEKYYMMAFIHFLANNYRIDGLARTSRGNSHDANWKTEVYIFNNGGKWSDELNSYRTEKGSLYVDETEVIDEKEITDDLIARWSERYDLTGDGEGGRLVYCSYEDGSGCYCFSFETCFWVGTAGTKAYSREFKGNPGCKIYLKRKNI